MTSEPRKKIALITGLTGHDGAYLSELLLAKGYGVHGIKRRASLFNTQRIDHLYQDPHETDRRFVLHHGDLTDSSNLMEAIRILGLERKTRFYQASTSELYGLVQEVPQKESTPFEHDHPP